MDYRKIIFGKADAIEESYEYPNLLIDGYLDNMNLVSQVRNSNTFLFLGYKGSGKSALSEHLRLIADKREMIVDQQPLNQFPYKSFAKIVSGDAEPEVKYHTAWRWLLLIKLLDNLTKDEKAVYNNKREILDAVVLSLNKAGLMPIKNFSSLVTKSSNVKVKANIIKLLEIEVSENLSNAELGLQSAISMIEELIVSFTECKEQYIIIDGIDDILTSREIQFATLAALLNQAKDINKILHDNNLPIKIIILCRTDIFERLHDPNINKIRQDCSYSFTWYKEGITTHEKNGLIEIANIRTQLVFPDCHNLFNTFFPSRINDEDIYSFLLEHTRHTPRDFMQVLIRIQNNCEGKLVRQIDVENGLKEYSVEYFLPEIKDEMEGYLKQDDIDNIIKIFSSYRKIEFDFNEILPIAERFNVSRDVLIVVLNVLYDCSAIGHVYYRGSEKREITYKYRNRNSCFNTTDRIRLHKGLWKALNVNF